MASFEIIKYNDVELISVHRTNAGEKRKALQKEATKLEREAQILKKISRMSTEAKIRQDEADRLNADAGALKRDARLEDLHVWKMEKIKTSKKGSKKYAYWMATWREGGKTRNVYLGSSRKMDAQAALKKARGKEGGGIGAKGEIIEEYFRPGRRTILPFFELTSYLALHETTQAAAIRQNPMVISIFEWESQVDRAAHTHEAEGSRAGRCAMRACKGGQDIDRTPRNAGIKS